LDRLRVIVALGGFAWDGVLRTLSARKEMVGRPRPPFGHRAEVAVGSYRLLGCFHPSQQNTFTGRLTPQMADDVFARAQELAGGGRP
jgi:uracil-DNA glycosylase